MGTLLAVTVNDPVPLAKVNPSIPAPLAALIMQLLEKDPASRPQAARDVIARLTEIERSLSGSATSAPSPPTRKRVPLVFVCGAMLFVALGIVAASIFFWQTPDGRVVRIECDDPSIQIAFDGGELKVTGAYKDPITLKPGQIGLKLTRGDNFEFETVKLVVNKGDKIVLRIEIGEGKVQIVHAGKGVLDSKELPVKPGPIAVADPDRRAAEWVLSLGGSVRVNGVKPDIKSADELPKEQFSLTTISLTGTAATDAGMANLIDVKGVTNLRLDHTEVTDAGLANLKGYTELRNLLLMGPGVSDAGLAHLKDCKALTRLYLEGTKVTNDGLAHLKDLTRLTQLTLLGAKVTDAGLVHLKNLEGLTFLDVRNTKVTAKRLALFHADMPGCKIVYNGGTIEATKGP